MFTPSWTYVIWGLKFEVFYMNSLGCALIQQKRPKNVQEMDDTNLNNQIRICLNWGRIKKDKYLRRRSTSTGVGSGVRRFQPHKYPLRDA